MVTVNELLHFLEIYRDNYHRGHSEIVCLLEKDDGETIEFPIGDKNGFYSDIGEDGKIRIRFCSRD